MPLAEWICIRPGAPTPTPFFFPDLSSTAAARPSFPTVVQMSHYANSSGGARARSSSRLPEQPQSLHRLGSSRWAKRHSLVPCLDCGMAQVVEGRTQKEGENHDSLYFKCARNSVRVWCVSRIWVRVLMCFWFCSTLRIVDFIISTRTISRCWRMLASLFFNSQTRSQILMCHTSQNSSIHLCWHFIAARVKGNADY
jgi:hypothetical protein